MDSGIINHFDGSISNNSPILEGLNWRATDWRDGRVAEGGGLLNRYTVKSCIEGSNPSLSAFTKFSTSEELGPKSALDHEV
jgi:hypothetical protein